MLRPYLRPTCPYDMLTAHTSVTEVRHRDVKMETSEGWRAGGVGNEGGSRQGGKLNVTSHI